MDDIQVTSKDGYSSFMEQLQKECMCSLAVCCMYFLYILYGFIFGAVSTENLLFVTEVCSVHEI